MDSCVLDFCVNKEPVKIPTDGDGEVDMSNSAFLPKVWARHHGRVACPTRKPLIWHQIGEHNTDVNATPVSQWNRVWSKVERNSATTVEKCRKACEEMKSEKGVCKAFVFGVEDHGYVC